ncbi:protein shortage in chiasmata 1 ortholog-like [Rhopilema esculentum]|uniref:protein shortage in chiasmata 1 ortholog-like n=1 Tax=Rhopilema esculentum TaxID=499914 RepID=UPI0031DC1B0B
MVTDSPLDTFMLLRTGEKATKEVFINKLPVAMVPPRSIVKAAKVKPSVFKDCATNAHEQFEKVTKTSPDQLKMKNKQFNNQEVAKNDFNLKNVKEGGNPAPSDESVKKNQVVSVDLPSNYIIVLRILEKDSRPLLGFLKERKILGHDYQFFSLKPDITRFLLRQQEKRHESSAMNANDADVMKGIICLHALVLSLDAIIHYGIPAAVGVLKHIREKYESFVGDLLESVRRQLAKQQYKLDADFQLHPKVEKITKMVQDLTSQSSNQKIMILVRRYFEYCYTSLEESLRLVKNVVIRRYPNDVAEEGHIREAISQANVIVAELSAELQFCPWSRIGFVIEFEYKEESEWSKFCFESNPHMQGFMSYDCTTGDLFGCKESVTCIQTDASIGKDKPMKCFSEHIIIGSRKITENKNLLSEIENRLNLTLIERDYSQFYKTFGEMEFYKQPDIIVDERTSIILLNEHELDGDNFHSKLTSLMSSMMLKCLNCYVIAVLFASKNTQFPYFAIESLSSFKLIFSKFKKASMTKFHLIYTFTHEETANWILKICNEARDSSPVWGQDEWGKRFWLTEEMSMHERFLLSFPMFTSFTAQIALTATPLKTLLSFTISEMKKSLKWIPERIIEAFHSSLNQNIFGDTNDCLSIPDNLPGPVCESQTGWFEKDHDEGSSAQGTSNCKRTREKSLSIEYHNSCPQEVVCSADDLEQTFEPNIYYHDHIENQGQHKLQRQVRKDESALDVNIDKAAYANPQIEYNTIC